MREWTNELDELNELNKLNEVNQPKNEGKNERMLSRK